MTELLLLVLLLPLCGCLFILTTKKDNINAFNVAVFTLFAVILLIVRLLQLQNMQMYDIEPYVIKWFKEYNAKLHFRADIYSLLLLLSVDISLLIGAVGLTVKQRKNKTLMLAGVYLAWTFGGLFCAGDMISFYIFFAAQLLPLFMLMGKFGNMRKNSSLSLFFIFNFAGIMLLLTAIILLYKFNQGNVLLTDITTIGLPPHLKLAVWSLISLSFIIRIPIWPFHYWISSISAGIKNPLVYIITVMLPLTGLYGFMRFWQYHIPQIVGSYVPVIAVFGILTMLFIAIIGTSHKDFLQKLFSYSTVYYLLFLLSDILLNGMYKLNIVYALFIFMIVNSSLAVLDLWSENACEESNCGYHGILAYMPRLSKIIAFFVLIAVGLPVSSMFWNNFVLISAIFKANFAVGLGIMISISMVGMALLYELYVMSDLQTNYPATEITVEDISDRKLAFFIGVIILVFLSFFNPLWFII